MIPLNSSEKNKLKGWKFIDLFAGIGGFHYALESFGAECVFASEWDSHAADTYELNHKLKPLGDITKIEEKDIPKHDILCGGFPCQAFSISGKQKGFEDTRGTLFFDIARIIIHHNPKVVFLENVKNFAKHDNGNTLNVVLTTMDELGYNVFYKVLNTSNYGLPQNRERIYIISFKKSLKVKNFKFPSPVTNKTSLFDLLEQNPEDAKTIHRPDIDIYKSVNTYQNLFGEKDYDNRPIQIGKVNKGGQGERIYHPSGHAITLSAYGGGAGSKTGLYLIDNKVRKLSPRECARAQGFPEEFILHNNPSQSYKQFGNSVSINVIQLIMRQVIGVLN